MEVMTISGDVVDVVENFKYSGSFEQEDGGFDMDVKHRIRCGWMKWKEVLGILCDKRIPDKVNFTRVRPSA
jgi:hypothetical protein